MSVRAEPALLPDQLDWLYAQQRLGVRPGLERVQRMLAALGHPERRFRSVLIAGTNGKGSVAASLAAMLQAQGTRTGLFTSPHLMSFAERFVVDGRQVEEAALSEGLNVVRPVAEASEATFFEIVTVLGCWLFAEAGVEWAVMEVGLGGRLDATNALAPELSVVTTVGLDHTELLGDTLAAIAAEKAGVLRPGRPAVTGVVPELLPVLAARKAELWAAGREISWQATCDSRLSRVTVTTPAGQLQVTSPLLGQHGAANVALAVAAAQRLGVPAAAIQSGAARTRWPGRLEQLEKQGRRWLLDGAHNADGAAALAAAVQQLFRPPVPLVFGASGDKDVAAVVAALAPVVGHVVLTRASLSPRAAQPADLLPLWQAQGVPCEMVPELPDALARAAGSGEPAADSPVLVAGSLYLVGEARALLLDGVTEQRERWQ